MRDIREVNFLKLDVVGVILIRIAVADGWVPFGVIVEDVSLTVVVLVICGVSTRKSKIWRSTRYHSFLLVSGWFAFYVSLCEGSVLLAYYLWFKDPVFWFNICWSFCLFLLLPYTHRLLWLHRFLPNTSPVTLTVSISITEFIVDDAATIIFVRSTGLVVIEQIARIINLLDLLDVFNLIPIHP